ncbi:MAG TPA: DUF4331 family protein [Candidatus Limnocylindrales bacterium]|nr:DUF4331 family protein [Candidatus Limnocylindrales bacterium]
MTSRRRTGATLGLLATAGLIAALGTGPFLVRGADHLDAPTAKSDHRIDITDIYAFRSAGGTTLALNVNPLTSPADTKAARFRTGTLYEILVDTNLNASADIAYRIRFGNTRTLSNGAVVQDYVIKRATGAAARRHEWSGSTVGGGRTTGYSSSATSPRVSSIVGGGKAFAGPRDDPFFFDLPGFVEFKKQLLAGSTDLGVLLGGFTGTDTFAGTNVSSIVIEVPNQRLGGSGRTIGVWATTSLPTSTGYRQVERMGRPAINTVFNTTNAEKEAFNRLDPASDRAVTLGNVVGVLDAIDTVLEANAASNYTDGEIQGLAKVLVPDTLTIKLGDGSGFLNGRRPADDVIDAEFSVLTKGNVTSDGVNANDRSFPTSFPYLARPH